MSQRNVEALRRVYEAMARGDFWVARAVFDPEIEWQWSPRVSGLTGRRTYHGIEGVEAATRDWFEAWERFSQEAEDFIEVGEQVVVLTRMHGRLKGSSREVESRAGSLWTFEGGKAIRYQGFDSRAEALEAAGLQA
ncbi:MAG: nuclear transport factor 2 family protein [Solirubrobacterales bacterium]